LQNATTNILNRLSHRELFARHTSRYF